MRNFFLLIVATGIVGLVSKFFNVSIIAGIGICFLAMLVPSFVGGIRRGMAQGRAGQPVAPRPQSRSSMSASSRQARHDDDDDEFLIGDYDPETNTMKY